jgi:hypothetical protein
MKRITIFSLLFIVLVCTALENKKESNNNNPSNEANNSKSHLQCQSVASFDFKKTMLSSHQDLAFCRQYKDATCCNRDHSMEIMKQVAPFFHDHDDGSFRFSNACREMSAEILCAPCNPFVGTQQIKGICISTCEKWYQACKDSLYTSSLTLQIVPCQESSAVCSKLSDIVSNGKQFCERVGFPVSDPAASTSYLRPLLPYLSASEIEEMDLGDGDTDVCFDYAKAKIASSHKGVSPDFSRKSTRGHYTNPHDSDESSMRRWSSMTWTELLENEWREIKREFNNARYHMQRRFQRMDLHQRVLLILAFSVMIAMIYQLFVKFVVPTVTQLIRTVFRSTSNIASASAFNSALNSASHGISSGSSTGIAPFQFDATGMSAEPSLEELRQWRIQALSAQLKAQNNSNVSYDNSNQHANQSRDGQSNQDNSQSFIDSSSTTQKHIQPQSQSQVRDDEVHQDVIVPCNPLKNAFKQD